MAVTDAIDFSLFAHHNKDRSWNDISYVLLNRIDSVDTFWRVFNTIKEQKVYDDFSLYFMKENIKPKWEDPRNISGGCLSYKINTTSLNEIHDLFLHTCIQCAENKIIEFDDIVNGVNVIVKSRHIIIKLWLSEIKNKVSLTKEFIQHIGIENIKKGIRQAHRSNIKRDIRKNTFYRYRSHNA